MQNTPKTLRRTLASAAATFALAFSFDEAHAATLYGWNTAVNVASISSNMDYDMAVNDAANSVGVVYRNNSGNLVFSSIARPTGTVSSPVTVMNGVERPSMAIDSNGGFHVVGYQTASTNLVYAYSTNGASWSSTTIDSNANRGRGTSIAIDSANRIHLAYRGQNGNDGGATTKGTGTNPFYDLFYKRFNGSAVGGAALTAGAWDAQQVLVHSSRATDGRTGIQVGDQIDNYGIQTSGTTAWIFRREGENAESAPGGYSFRRSLTATSGTAFTESGSGGLFPDSTRTASMKGAFDLTPAGDPVRLTWDRTQLYMAPGTSDGSIAVPYNSSGIPIDQNLGTAGYQGQGVDIGLHSPPSGAGYFNVGQRPALISDVKGDFYGAYYRATNYLGNTTGLQFAFRNAGNNTWLTEVVPGASSYANFNRTAFDYALFGSELGEVYILSSNGSTLSLFSRSVSIPEPMTGALLGLGVLGLTRRRQATS